MSKCSNVQSFADKGAEDVPLRKAIVAASGISPKVYPATRRVVTVLRYRTNGNLEARAYECTWGADSIWFRLGTKKQQLRILLETKCDLIECYDVPEPIVHNALLVIPEYRRAMQRAGRK